MTEDFSQLEEQLRALRPIAPGTGLERRVAEALREPARVSRRWWEALGFSHPSAAFGWGIVMPAAAAVVAVTLFQMATAVTPVSTGTREQAAQNNVAQVTATESTGQASMVTNSSQTAVGASDTLSQIRSGAASTVVYETSDEGVVLTNDQQPARRVRYLSEDTLTWRNPRTGADIEVSYPREEVVLTPIAAR